MALETIIATPGIAHRRALAPVCCISASESWLHMSLCSCIKAMFACVYCRAWHENAGIRVAPSQQEHLWWLTGHVNGLSLHQKPPGGPEGLREDGRQRSPRAAPPLTRGGEIWGTLCAKGPMLCVALWLLSDLCGNMEELFLKDASMDVQGALQGPPWDQRHKV